MSNRERDAFLDWFAAHRCAPRDARWEYCKSEAQRWSGCCLELRDLFPRGEVFVVSETEYAEAGTAFWPHVAQLLRVVSQITRGEWQRSSGSKEIHVWRDIVRPLEFTGTECGFQDGLGRASVGAGTKNYQWSTFLRGIHDAFQDDIIQKV